MTTIPISNQIPNEVMYINGRMTAAWYQFFIRLAKAADLTAFSDLLALIQLANQQPLQANSGTHGEQIAQLESIIQSLPIPPTPESAAAIMPLSQVAFFYPEETLPLSPQAASTADDLLPLVMQNLLPVDEVLPGITLTQDYLEVITP